MTSKRISERKLILFTVALLIVSGIARLISYKVGVWLFYLSFLPIVLHRVNFYLRNHKNLLYVDSIRRYTLGILLGMVVLNFIGFQNVEFVLLLILAIDYIIVAKYPRKKLGEQDLAK